MVNRNIVTAKLTDLAAQVARVRAHGKASSAELATELHKHAILTQPTSEALARAAGLRNVVAHGYAGIDVALVYAAATQGVAELDAFAREVASWIAAH